MESKLLYRVGNIETNQGLWYDWDGNYTGLIHNEFDFCKNSDLPMPFDDRLVDWLSATDTLDNLWSWFSREEVYRLQDHGWYVYGYVATNWKPHENHQVIEKQTSIPFFRLIIDSDYQIRTMEQIMTLNIQQGRRSALLN